MIEKIWTSRIDFSKISLFGVIKSPLSAQEHLMNNNYNKYLTVSVLACKIQDRLKF